MNNGTLPSLIDTMEGMLAAAEIQVADAQAALDRAKADVRQLQNMLKAAGWLPPEEAKKPPKKSKGSNARVGEATVAKVMDAIIGHAATGEPALADVPGSFIVSDINAGVHNTSVRQAINQLREEGLIRAVGKKKIGAARSPVAYAITRMEDDVLRSPEARALAGLTV